MALRMVQPTRRSGSTYIQFRKRIPSDVLRVARGQKATIRFSGENPGDPETSVTVTFGTEIRFSLQTRDPPLAKQRTGAANYQLERLFQAYRNGPRPLLQKERVAFAGLLYREWAEQFEDAPGEPEFWQLVKEVNDRASCDPERLEKWFGPLADEFLAREAIIIDQDSRQALLKEVARALTEAAEKLQRNAAGDYRPDLTAERFPKWKGIQASRPFATAADASLEAIFDKWVAEAAPAPSTITTWRSYVNQLREHVGHNDARRITRADLLTWKDALVAKGRAPKGINGGQLAAVRSIFNYAVSNDIFSENPALGVSVRQRKKAGAKMQPYTDQEVARLLRLADKESSVYRSWLPWLMALSGARAGELAQLWGRRIIEVDGVRVKKIAPAEDGGTLKNEGSERDVPIHREILDRGFLDFVRSRGEGPLFYKGIRAKSAPLEAPGRRHASKGVVNHLAEWVRENGFTDPRKAPNHALRHWFKSACQRADIQDSIADAIQGHKGSRGEADAYRHADVLTMARAIARIKVPEPTGSEAELTSHGNQPGAVRG